MYVCIMCIYIYTPRHIVIQKLFGRVVLFKLDHFNKCFDASMNW